MSTVRQRREKIERGRLTLTSPRHRIRRGRAVFLVSNTKTTTKIDDDTGEPVASFTHEAHVEEAQGAAQRLVAMRKAGDDRVANHRVFRLAIDDTGKPTIGTEVRS